MYFSKNFRSYHLQFIIYFLDEIGKKKKKSTKDSFSSSIWAGKHCHSLSFSHKATVLSLSLSQISTYSELNRI